MIGIKIKELQIGQSASFTKTIAECDVYNFIGITGDVNPIHIDEVYAGTTVFKKRIAHGMLTAGLISTVIGNSLPGPGTVYLDQQLEFTSPVYFGDTITAVVRVLELIPEKNRVVLETTCTNQKGEIVIVGKAVVLPPK